jgi:Protein of unknown function (DUF2959)
VSITGNPLTAPDPVSWTRNSLSAQDGHLSCSGQLSVGSDGRQAEDSCSGYDEPVSQIVLSQSDSKSLQSDQLASVSPEVDANRISDGYDVHNGAVCDLRHLVVVRDDGHDFSPIALHLYVKDRRDAYKKLQKEMATSDKKRAEVSMRNGEMNVEADKLFKSWEGSTAAIQDPELRQRSQQRLARAKE